MGKLSESKRCTLCHMLFPRLPKYFHYDKSRTDGLNSRCKPCGNKFAREWSLDKNHKPIIRKRVNTTYYNKRHACIELLGGKCVCCGVTEWWNLTIDHIDWRTKDKTKSITLYNRLLRGIDLQKFQILCFGCNSSKHRYTKCQIHNNRDELK